MFIHIFWLEFTTKTKVIYALIHIEHIKTHVYGSCFTIIDNGNFLDVKFLWHIFSDKWFTIKICKKNIVGCVQIDFIFIENILYFRQQMLSNLFRNLNRNRLRICQEILTKKFNVYHLHIIGAIIPKAFGEWIAGDLQLCHLQENHKKIEKYFYWTGKAWEECRKSKQIN